MNLKKKLLQKSNLYVIIDKKICGNRSVSGIARKLRDSGVDIVQFRDKISSRRDFFRGAEIVSKVFTGSPVLFIINDYPDAATVIECDGIHIGQDDFPVWAVRKIIGREKIIGVSCHSGREAVRAEREGADYIGIGPVFPTLTKPEASALGTGLVRYCKREVHLPFFPIGGITESNAGNVLSSGARTLCVCGAILNADNINKKVKEFKRILERPG